MRVYRASTDRSGRREEIQWSRNEWGMDRNRLLSEVVWSRYGSHRDDLSNRLMAEWHPVEAEGQRTEHRTVARAAKEVR